MVGIVASVMVGVVGLLIVLTLAGSEMAVLGWVFVAVAVAGLAVNLYVRSRRAR